MLPTWPSIYLSSSALYLCLTIKSKKEILKTTRMMKQVIVFVVIHTVEDEENTLMYLETKYR